MEDVSRKNDQVVTVSLPPSLPLPSLTPSLMFAFVSVSCSIHGCVPFSLPLSFPSFPSLFCPSSLHVAFAFVAPLSPPLPLFPLTCRICVLIHGGMLSSLPSLAPLLAYTTASLSPAPCLCSWLAPLQSPHRASFAFMTPLVIVFTFTSRS
jgi:hypothetical protein